MIDKIRKEWNAYKLFLQEKYPAKDGEEWAFTCEHHKRIDKLLASDGDLADVSDLSPEDQEEIELLNIKVSNMLMIETSIPVEKLVDIAQKIDGIYKTVRECNAKSPIGTSDARASVDGSLEKITDTENKCPNCNGEGHVIAWYGGEYPCGICDTRGHL